MGIPGDWGQWIVFLGVLIVAAGMALAVHYVLITVLAGLARRTASEVDDLLIRHLRRPLRWVLVIIRLRFQVTNATERTVELRVLVSAAHAGAAWDLRCHVRERLIEFVQRRYPHALPRLRTQFEESENRRSDDA